MGETQVEFLMAEAGRTYKQLLKEEATRRYLAACPGGGPRGPWSRLQ